MMDKRTVASAHKRIDNIETKLVAHEAVCGERWKETILRIKRICQITIYRKVSRKNSAMVKFPKPEGGQNGAASFI